MSLPPILSHDETKRFGWQDFTPGDRVKTPEWFAWTLHRCEGEVVAVTETAANGTSKVVVVVWDDDDSRSECWPTDSLALVKRTDGDR